VIGVPKVKIVVLKRIEPKVVFRDAVPRIQLLEGNSRNIQSSRSIRLSLLRIVVRCLLVFALGHSEIFTKTSQCYSTEFLGRKKVKQ
jgi:hypothetical protein